MAYRDDLARVASSWNDDIRADLTRTRELLDRSRAETAEYARQEAVLSWLLTLVEKNAAAAAQLTLHEAMAAVLRTAPQRMMRAGDLAAEINARGLYRMRDGRPVEAQQVHARVGHNPHMFVREGTFIKLAG